ncbi:Uncharacterised protein [Mycoplasmopsis maculosa]|uniref:Lipoprotein n=1 Tax=Mycoplasmopsis maculosa TaxID=114885 RepID=A0A449B525_9BACT|nr:hypothetical protein [Mycoplasmopsis maculosa]VEU75628.1 Uncharacterised protein [Mycoplasmopsis maculosa]
MKKLLKIKKILPYSLLLFSPIVLTSCSLQEEFSNKQKKLLESVFGKDYIEKTSGVLKNNEILEVEEQFKILYSNLENKIITEEDFINESEKIVPKILVNFNVLSFLNKGFYYLKDKNIDNNVLSHSATYKHSLGLKGFENHGVNDLHYTKVANGKNPRFVISGFLAEEDNIYVSYNRLIVKYVKTKNGWGISPKIYYFADYKPVFTLKNNNDKKILNFLNISEKDINSQSIYNDFERIFGSTEFSAVTILSIGNETNK